MSAHKTPSNGTWYVQFRYTDWKGERKNKLKRGFATKKEALAWERQFLMQTHADLNMTLASFCELYEQDIKPKLKLNTRRSCPILENARYPRSPREISSLGRTKCES